MTLRRGVGFVFALIGLALVVSVAALVVLYFWSAALDGRARGCRRRRRWCCAPPASCPSCASDGVVGQFVDRGDDSLRALVGALRRAKTDPRITSVVVIPGSLDSPYWGQAAGAARRRARLPPVQGSR